MRYVFLDNAGAIRLAINDSMRTAIPPGAIEISAADWERRFHLVYENGAFVERAPLGPSNAEISARLLPELRVRRAQAMSVLDGLQADALTAADMPTARAIKDAKQACRDLPALDVSAAVGEAGIRAMYLAEWRRIAALVPAPVRVAFVAVLT
jgi:hypothetical protein